MIRALTLAALLTACGGGQDPAAATAAFHVTWTFELADGTPTDCAGAGTARIIALVDQGRDFESVPTILACAAGGGDTRPVPLGAYTVQLEQYDTLNYFQRATAKVDAELPEEGTIVDVPTFVLVVEPPP